jgi:hypothetical protein
MLPIPERILIPYETSLLEQNIPLVIQNEYKKWLRFYLDFCKKYQLPAGKQSSLPAFIEKLHNKRQAKTQCQQAQHAIELFFSFQRSPLECLPSRSRGLIHYISFLHAM